MSLVDSPEAWVAGVNNGRNQIQPVMHYTRRSRSEWFATKPFSYPMPNPNAD